MSYAKFIDVSRWQGDINWSAVRNSGVVGAIIKMSGGDDGLYYDTKASQNYYQAKAAGVAVGGYHFAGATDPVSEAEYFVRSMSPFEENDVFVLDWEVQHSDPVGWCNTFVTRVHEMTGCWPLIYMNGSTRNAYNWDVVAKNCGMWIAWWGKDPEGDLPVTGPYVMHQYTSDGTVPGIAGRVDLDAWFGTVEQFNKYGYHAPQPQLPEPEPTPPDPEQPPPDPEPTPPDPEPEPPEPEPEPPLPDPPPAQSLWVIIATAVAAAIAFVLALIYGR